MINHFQPNICFPVAAGRQEEVPVRRPQLWEAGDAPAGRAAEEGKEVEDHEDDIGREVRVRKRPG